MQNKEVFDKLEEGQELTMTQDKDRIYFQFDGKQVGYIGKPKVVNGTYSSPYEYFLFRIRPNGKDTYYSKLADVFKAIVNAKDGELKEVIVEFKYFSSDTLVTTLSAFEKNEDTSNLYKLIFLIYTYIILHYVFPINVLQLQIFMLMYYGIKN